MTDHQDPGTVREGQKAGAGAEPLFWVCFNQSSEAGENTAGNHRPFQSPTIDAGLLNFSNLWLLPSLYAGFSIKKILFGKRKVPFLIPWWESFSALSGGRSRRKIPVGSVLPFSSKNLPSFFVLGSGLVFDDMGGGN